MPKTELNVNGVQIETDKIVKSISDSRVNFTDGSWCDVRSGMVINRGKGFVQIVSNLKDLPGAGITERVVFDSKKNKATRIKAVRVHEVKAMLEIQSTLEDSVSVFVSGAGSNYQDIKVEQEGETLVVSDLGSAGIHVEQMVVSGRGAVGIQLGYNSSISDSNVASVQIGGSTAASPTRFLRIKIYVPKGTALEIDDVDGNIAIGDTEGTVLIRTVGVHHTNIGKIRDLDLSKSGVGEVVVGFVDGDCTIVNKGIGPIVVRDGDTSMLVVKVIGTGQINYGGNATDAKLVIEGVGSIQVAHVKNKPKMEVGGSRRIIVSNW